MGLIADIYVARGDEAPGYDTAPDQFAERAQRSGFTPLELSVLWSIMRGIEWDPGLMEGFACLLEGDSGQRMIHMLPAEMVSELSGLTAEQVAAVSPEWAATEELGWPPEEAREVVEDLVRLSRTATESGQSVYLWNCA